MCDNSPTRRDETAKVALIDFCGTVVDFTTAVAFTRFVAAEMPTRHAHRTDRVIAWLHRLRVTGLVRHLFPALSVVKRLNAYKLKGYTHGQLTALAARYYEERIKPHLIIEVLDELERLRGKGYRLIIASGAFDIYVNHFAQEMGIGDVLATRLKFDDKGVCTGRFDGSDLMGKRKVMAINTLLGKDVNRSQWFAFSDSRDDLPMLRLAPSTTVVSHGEPQAWATRLKLRQIIYHD